MDESLSFGTVGKTGRGLVEAAGLKATDVDVITITLESSLASVGGVCVGSVEVVDHQRLSGAGYCFSASAPPFVSSAAIAALKVLEAEPALVAKLQANIKVSQAARLPGCQLPRALRPLFMEIQLDIY